MTAMETPTQQNAVAQVRRELRAESFKAAMRAVGKSLLVGFSTIVIVLLIWVAVLWAFQVTPFIGKGPVDVYNFFFVGSDAAGNRETIGKLFSVTMAHSFIGFASGMVAATIIAVLFRISKSIESALMPLAMLLRSVPLVALAPVIILIFGTGTTSSVAVIGGIVVLFPALVNIVFGLRGASEQMLDVVRVYGGGTTKELVKVAIPAALPSFFAAIRISVPGAVTGALLAEWLSTGDGIGGAIQEFIPQVQFNAVWASVVVVTFVSIILYAIVQFIESLVLVRMGMGNQR